MPSAPSSTIAPRPELPLARTERVEGERVASAERAERRRRVDRVGEAGGRAVEVPLRDLVAVDPDLEVHHLWVDLVGGDHARADRDRDPLGAASPARRSRRAPASRSRACSRTGVATHRTHPRVEVSSPSTAATFGSYSSHAAPSGHGTSCSGPITRRSTSSDPGDSSDAGNKGVRMRGRLTRQSKTSSRARAVRAASMTVPRLLETRPSSVVGKAGCPTASGRSTTSPSKIAPSRRCPPRS